MSFVSGNLFLVVPSIVGMRFMEMEAAAKEAEVNGGGDWRQRWRVGDAESGMSEVANQQAQEGVRKNQKTPSVCFLL